MKETHLSLRALYDQKKEAPSKFREEIMNLLKISRETFFIRMKNNSWTAPEKQLISLFYNVEVEVLFPETEECHD